MKARFAATMELQRPSTIPPRPPDPPPHVGRAPEQVPVFEVCPHCRQETSTFLVSVDGHCFEVHRCLDHGDVVPMRSAVANAPRGT
jgi:hypothetical protein